MRKIDAMPLFDAVDLAADMMRATICDYSPADDQIIFRKLQKQRLPPKKVQNLFDLWQERYAGKCVQDRKRVIANVVAIAEEYAKTNPPAPPFRCPCGEQTKDPFDPAWLAIHQPHCQAAGEERIAREQRERSARQGGGLTESTARASSARWPKVRPPPRWRSGWARPSDGFRRPCVRRWRTWRTPTRCARSGI
jgi:hypothetical protein